SRPFDLPLVAPQPVTLAYRLQTTLLENRAEGSNLWPGLSTATTPDCSVFGVGFDQAIIPLCVQSYVTELDPTRTSAPGEHRGTIQGPPGSLQITDTPPNGTQYTRLTATAVNHDGTNPRPVSEVWG